MTSSPQFAQDCPDFQTENLLSWETLSPWKPGWLVVLENVILSCVTFALFWGQGSANYDPWAKSSLQPVFVNEVLLEYNKTHSLMYYLRLFSQYND